MSMGSSSFAPVAPGADPIIRSGRQTASREAADSVELRTLHQS
jgi:hypothetical protein